MQILYKRAVIRALIGGHWERSEILGWYKHDRTGAVPPNIIESEDNTDIAIAIRVSGLLCMLTGCIATIAVLQAGWPA
jgi:hypothetical protein